MKSWLLAVRSKETQANLPTGPEAPIMAEDCKLDPRGSTSRPTRLGACFVSFLSSQLAMAGEQRVIYLEDVETTVSNGEVISVTPSPSQDAPVKAPVKTKSSEATGTVKRQRTLMDMLSGPSNDKSAEPVAKKAKLTASSSGSGSAKIAVVGVQRLNAIPFSLSQYIESIPEDHRDLLKLETECMGKSWCVRRSHNNSPFCF